MQVSKIFKAASVTFKQYFNKMMVFGITWGIITGVIYVLFSLLVSPSLAIIATLIAALPLQVSLGIISIKTVNRQNVENHDFYIGFKNFYSSIFLQVKVLLKGLLFAVIGTFIGAVVGGLVITMVFTQLEPEIIAEFMNTGDTEVFYEAFSNVSWMNAAMIGVDILAIVCGAIFFIWKGMDKAFTPFICYETRFSVQNAIEMSEICLKTYKKSYFRFNFVFFLLLIPIGGACYGLYALLGLTNLSNEMIFAIPTMLLFILSGILLVFRHIANYHAYHHYFRSQVMTSYNQYVEKMNNMNNQDPNTPVNQNNESQEPLDYVLKDDKDEEADSGNIGPDETKDNKEDKE